MFNLLGFCRLAAHGERLGVDLWGFRAPWGASLEAAPWRLLTDWSRWPAVSHYA